MRYKRNKYSRPIDPQPKLFANQAEIEREFREFANNPLAQAISDYEETQIDGEWFVVDTVTQQRMAGPFLFSDDAVRWIRDIRIVEVNSDGR